MMKYGESEINKASEALLELWDFTGEDTLIHLEFPEFTSLCPRSGYPDFGTIIIDYIPDKKIAELKSIKLYINSFRNLYISHEETTQEIYKKLSSEIGPKQLRVIGDFKRRGGVKTVVSIPSNSHLIFPQYVNDIL